MQIHRARSSYCYPKIEKQQNDYVTVAIDLYEYRLNFGEWSLSLNLVYEEPFGLQ